MLLTQLLTKLILLHTVQKVKENLKLILKKVPEVANSNSEISNLLSNPDISFNKQSNLKNGDKVEVTITLNKNTANKLKLKTTGEFKRTFTVNGLK